MDLLRKELPMFKEWIKSYMKANESSVLADLQELISYRSVTGDWPEIVNCLDHFLKQAEEMGFKVFRTSAGDVGIVEAGQGNETLGILVHLDVVEPGDLEKWKFPPFQATIADGYLWGRGTMDDKGAAVMILHALKALRQYGAEFRKRVWLIVGTSEESEWTDMENFIREFPCPDYGFSPDGDFPISNIENGYADVVFEFDESIKIKMFDGFRVDAGKDPNTIPSKATLERNRSVYCFDGISAHSSTPEEGNNAIELLCRSGLCDDLNFCRFITEVLDCDPYGGKLRPEKEEEIWENQELVKTTFVPTVLKQEGANVRLTVNIRQNPSVQRCQLEEAFERYQAAYHYRYQIMEFLEPMKVSRNLEPFRIMAETYEDWSRTNNFISAGGTSYAKAMRNFVSWGPCFPEEPSCAHQENERIRISALFEAMGIYADYIYRIIMDERNLSER